MANTAAKNQNTPPEAMPAPAPAETVDQVEGRLMGVISQLQNEMADLKLNAMASDEMLGKMLEERFAAVKEACALRGKVAMLERQNRALQLSVQNNAGKGSGK